MAADELWSWSAVDLADAIAAKKISSREATQSAVARMRARNPSINAVTHDLGDEAMTLADAADAAVARGDTLGPLHGVPVTVKQNVDFKGMPNVNGVPAYEKNIAPGDSPVVANLRRAGAVPIGLTNTPEFSMRAVTENPLYGRTLNPWDHAITCGGSSGGAGASVALGIGAVAHGNDIGGSLRWPAFCNGVSTIRPTQGRVPAYNPSATVERPLLAQLMSTQGPLAREMRDVALALKAMSQRDPRDPFWVPAPLDGPPVAKKVAIAEIPKGAHVHPAVLKAVDDAARMLREAGYEVTPMATPDVKRPLELWWRLLGAEMRHLQGYMLEIGSPTMKKLVTAYLEIGGDISIADYMGGLAERTGHIRRWLTFLEETPLVLSPLCFQPSLAPDGDVGDASHVKKTFDDFLFQTGLNLLGLPCVVTPTGLHEGRPIGVQLIASRFREDVALAAGEAIGQRVGVLAKELWKRTG